MIAAPPIPAGILDSLKVHCRGDSNVKGLCLGMVLHDRYPRLGDNGLQL